MGTKDITEKYLAAYNDVFADIINVLLFKGKRVITPDSLEPAQPTAVYKADGKVHEEERDISKKWTQNNMVFSIFGLENQTSVFKNMPLRVVGYDGAAYRNELNRKGKKYPVITIVLYFGTQRRWGAPENLLDCLEIPDELRTFVSDYKINVFNVAFLSDEQIQLFQSDFRIVADYFVQVRKNNSYTPSKEKIKHVDAVLKLMSVLTNDVRFESIQNMEGEVSNMCEVLDAAEARGEALGEARGAKALIETYQELGFPVEKTIDGLIDKMNLSREAAKEYIGMFWK